jgi:hypothetical protein
MLCRCSENFLQITDTTGTVTSCGNERPKFVESLCSKTVYVSYNAEKKPSGIINFNKGFKLYFESIK